MGRPKQRSGWQEKDPANPHLGFSLLVGIGIMAAILLLGLVLRRTYVYTILFERGWVNFAETFVFGWGMSIIILKFVKLGHQRNALLLDVIAGDDGLDPRQRMLPPRADYLGAIRDGISGLRIGILREAFGLANSEKGRRGDRGARR